MGINFGRIVTDIKGKIDTKLHDRSERLRLEKLEDEEYKAALAKARKEERIKAIPHLAKAQVGLEVSQTIAGLKSGKNTKKETGLWSKMQNAGANFSAGITNDMSMFDGGFGGQQPQKKDKKNRAAVRQSDMFGGFSAPAMDFSIPKIGFGVAGTKPTGRKRKR